MSIEYGHRDLSDGQRAYFAWLNAHYVTDEQAEIIKAGFDRIRLENTKLRELARAAWRCIHTGASCSDCRLIAGGCILQTAMRELGVDV